MKKTLDGTDGISSALKLRAGEDQGQRFTGRTGAGGGTQGLGLNQWAHHGLGQGCRITAGAAPGLAIGPFNAP
jgi:hypothetical protein